jgi:tRNA 2-thiocytidine biosynthesis protein TtcA
LSKDPSDRLAYWLIKKINKANRDFELIAGGDRIAVAISGGKDSLTLLQLLHRRRRSVPSEYTLVPVHIVSDWRCTDEDQRAWLEQHFQSLGLEYAFREITIMDGEDAEPGCFWCAWNRRKALFQTAHELGCNKVAFGHHADDIAQTTLLNLFYQSRLETMEPKVEFFDGIITLIRPLAYVPEKEIVRFAQAAGFPVQETTCPHAPTSRRATMARLLRQIEAEVPRAKLRLFRAVQRGKGTN